MINFFDYETCDYAHDEHNRLYFVDTGNSQDSLWFTARDDVPMHEIVDDVTAAMHRRFGSRGPGMIKAIEDRTEWVR